jgi:hypothetical protein
MSTSVETMTGLPSARPTFSRPLVVALVVIGILILGDLNGRMADALRLEQDAGLLRGEVASLEGQQAALQTQIAEVVNDYTVEQWARREAKMVRPGERLVLAVPASGASEPEIPASETAAPLPSAWQVWWALLFGE